MIDAQPVPLRGPSGAEDQLETTLTPGVSLDTRPRHLDNHLEKRIAFAVCPQENHMRIHNRSAAIVLTGTLALCVAGVCAQSPDMQLTVRDVAVPGLVWYKPAETLDHKTPLVLDDGSGKIIHTQFDAEGHLWWYQPTPCDAKGNTYRLRELKPGEGKPRGIKVEAGKAATYDVTIDGQPFTVFNYDKDTPKPYLYPVIGPTGAGVTRNFPMKDLPEERAQGKRKSRQDHPHHRSIWTAYGDVRLGDFDKVGTDYWAVGKGKGLQKVTKIAAVQSGPVFGLIEADIDWTNAAGKKELSETRTYRFFKAVPTSGSWT